jgi:hypothetical protein
MVVHFSALLSRNPREVWLLPWVRRVLIHDDTLSQKVQLDLLCCLTIVKTNLNSTSALASAEHVVLIDHRADHVLTARNLFQILSLCVSIQV